MDFSATKTRKLLITISLKGDASGVRGWFTLNRYAAGVRTPIENSGEQGSDQHTFFFDPSELSGWEAQSMLDFDFHVTFMGATKADVLIGVKQLAADGKTYQPCPPLDEPGALLTVTKANTSLRSGAFYISF